MRAELPAQAMLVPLFGTIPREGHMHPLVVI
jgi:hypothetical protein